MSGGDGVQLQRLRDFIVQIRDPRSDVIVGTGFIVSTEGDVVTCAHVVQAGTGATTLEPGMEVLVYLPAGSRVERKRGAKVGRVFEGYDDDVVLLRITDDVVIEPSRVAVLGTCQESQGNSFQSYGYRRLDDFLSGWAEGEILGPVEAPEDGTYQAEPIQLSSSQINRGMSGAPLLDKQRNLVVGVISDTWFPDESTKDRDTAWAVDGTVLSLDPIGLPLRDEPLPLLPTRTTHSDSDTQAAERLGVRRLDVSWNVEPDLLPKLGGRDALLAALMEDWLDPGTTITSVVGFGGEGKSVLARQWVEDVLHAADDARPDGVFWWSFQDKPDVDELFDALLEYLTQGKIDPSKIGSTAAKVQFASAMLPRGRYLLVFDGMETVQYLSGDRYGEVVSEPLTEFLVHFAAPDTRSFALLTSRIQVHDIKSYTTVRERELDRLLTADGVTLLRQAGVTGPGDMLSGIVERWDGHALTISLLGSYISEAHGGMLPTQGEVAPPLSDTARYAGVARVLRSYDERFGPADRATLLLFSAFRRQIDPTVAFGPIASGWDLSPLLEPLAGWGPERLQALAERLEEAHVLRYDHDAELLTMHPLIQAHYRAQLTATDEPARQQLHRMIASAFLVVAGVDQKHLEERSKGTYFELEPLSELHPVIEAVHHLCRAGDNHVARVVVNEWIDRGLSTSWLSARLGASEAALDVEMAFYVHGDLRRPMEYAELNATGVQLQNLGRLEQALSLFQQRHARAVESQEWEIAVISARNLSHVSVLLGDLDAAGQWSRETLKLTDRAGGREQWGRWQDLASAGWIAEMQGRRSDAQAYFDEMLAAARDGDEEPTILGGAGTEYAESLLQTGDLKAAAGVVLTNLQAAKVLNRPQEEADGHRLLGHIYAAVGQREKAREAFETAVTLAFSKGTVATRLRALTARGRWLAAEGAQEAALVDLQTALERALTNGYGLVRIDALVGLAETNLVAGRHDAARDNARTASYLAVNAAYAWGEQAALKVLHALEATSPG
jgi:tetratricopeptide (TPR) repeat protein